MREQTLTFQKGDSLCIETPWGLVEMERVDARKVLFRLPDGLTAHKGVDRAMEHARFVEGDVKNGYRPRSRVLTAVTDGAGNVVDWVPPKAVRIGK